jgi:hypothetical protein
MGVTRSALNSVPAPESSGKADLDATLALVPGFVAACVFTLQFSPFAYCNKPDDFEHVTKKIAAAK